MDRAEYQGMLDQIQNSVAKKDYQSAYKLATEIDWRRVKSLRTLNMVADIYEYNKDYEGCKKILLIAKSRASIGKGILYRLVEICVRLGQVEEAKNYYKQYEAVAGNDSGRYLLKYEIAKAAGIPLEQQIALLEKYKENEYTEKWSYELAELYSKAGNKEKCIEVCDDMILWFSEGKYVLKAMELKQRYTELSPSQLEYYNKEQKDSDPRLYTGDMSFAASILEKGSAGAAPVVDTAKIEIPPEYLQNSQNGNVMERIEAAGAKATENVSYDKTGYLEYTGDEIDKFSVTSPMFMGGTPDLKTQLADSVEKLYPGAQTDEKPAGSGAESAQETPETDTVPDEEDVVSAQLNDFLKTLEQPAQTKDINPEAAAAVAAAGTAAVLGETKTVGAVQDITKEPEVPAVPEEPVMAKEAKISMEVPSASVKSAEDAAAVFEAEKDSGAETDTEESRTDSKKDHSGAAVLAAAGAAAAGAAALAAAGDASKHQTGSFEIPKIQKEEKVKPAASAPAETFEYASLAAPAAAEAAPAQTAAYTPIPEAAKAAPVRTEAHTSIPAAAKAAPVQTEAYASMPSAAEAAPVQTEARASMPSAEEAAPALAAAAAVTAASAAAANTGLPKESAPASAFPSDWEIPDPEESPETKKSHTIPLDKIGQNTVPIPIEEILRHETPEERRIRIISNASPTKMNDEQRQVFTYFSRIPGMDSQILEAVSSVYRYAGEHTSRIGNIAVMGAAGMGKTRLTYGLIVMMCKDMKLDAAKIARVSGERMNEIDPVALVSEMSGGFLAIENAGDMQAQAVEKLNQAMEFKTNRMIIILEDEKNPMRALFRKYPLFAEKFNGRISIPAFTNDELVTFARTYCAENNCELDEMGILALYTMISNSQSEEQPVSIKTVKEMVDGAIAHARRTGRKARRGSKSRKIVLYEKDFVV